MRYFSTGFRLRTSSVSVLSHYRPGSSEPLLSRNQNPPQIAADPFLLYATMATDATDIPGLEPQRIRSLPPGLYYLPSFLSPEEQRSLLDKVSRPAYAALTEVDP